MSFEKAKDFLMIATKKYKLGKQAKASLVCERARKVIAENYTQFSDQWKPHKFENGVLFIEVSDSASSSELFMQTHHMLEKFLDSELSEVQEIRIIRRKQ